MINLNMVIVCMFGCLAVYLFVTAPPELPDIDAVTDQERVVDVSNMFNAMNAINDVARRIYTSRIVGGGKEAGLAFGEDWADPLVEKGPLPALFTRLVAARMETKPPQLGLYLGSDKPINKSNLFSGPQAIAFSQLKTTQAGVNLKSDDAGFVAMYPDVASAKPCVSCHNEHSDSPKTDWKLNEVMGATTWTYPYATLGSAEYLEVTETFYASVREAYQIYLDKAAGFQDNVLVGEAWPEKGKTVLPDASTFIAAVKAESAVMVLNDLVLDASAEFKSIDLEAAQ